MGSTGLSFSADSNDSIQRKAEQRNSSQIKWATFTLCARTVLEFNPNLFWVHSPPGTELKFATEFLGVTTVTVLYYPKSSTGIKKIEKYWHLPLAVSLSQKFMPIFFFWFSIFSILCIKMIPKCWRNSCSQHCNRKTDKMLSNGPDGRMFFW